MNDTKPNPNGNKRPADQERDEKRDQRTQEERNKQAEDNQKRG
ncbi:hypothetical protein [Luteimonas galliterrae]|nr:hypothetical protein [Luteimonas galliterrae]